jgi:hypothetical protein
MKTKITTCGSSDNFSITVDWINLFKEVKEETCNFRKKINGNKKK